MNIIGIDGGGTKTDFVLCKENGVVKKRVKESGTNINDIGFDNFCKVISCGMNKLLLESEDESTVIFGGFSGGATGQNKEKINIFLNELLPFANVNNDSDIMNVISLGLGTKDGIAVISGTGSIAYAQKDGFLYRAGGWGYLFDPAGSGYHIGRDAIYSSLSAIDGTGNPTILISMLEKKIGCSIQNALADIYKKGKDYIASFAPLVFDAYRENDSESVHIVEKTAKHLAKLITVSGKHFEQNELKVALAGGMFKDADILVPLIYNHLSGKEYSLTVQNMPPVYGAVLLACRQNSIEIDENFKYNFELTLKENAV